MAGDALQTKRQYFKCQYVQRVRIYVATSSIKGSHLQFKLIIVKPTSFGLIVELPHGNVKVDSVFH